jgi:cell division protease FtsH
LATARTIDQEVKRIVTTCYERALGLLKANQKILVTLAEMLIERETVEGTEVRRLVQGVASQPA